MSQYIYSFWHNRTVYLQSEFAISPYSICMQFIYSFYSIYVHSIFAVFTAWYIYIEYQQFLIFSPHILYTRYFNFYRTLHLHSVFTIFCNIVCLSSVYKIILQYIISTHFHYIITIYLHQYLQFKMFSSFNILLSIKIKKIWSHHF